jgi:hypothetical protein
MDLGMFGFFPLDRYFAPRNGCRMILGESMRDGFGNVLER